MERSLLSGTCLEDVARELELTGWAAQLFDPEWRLVWVSPELKQLIGESDDDRLGYGMHMLEGFEKGGWIETVTPETTLRWLAELVPQMVRDTPGGEARLRELVPPELWESVESALEQEPSDLWASHIDFLQGDLPPTRVNCVGARARSETGEMQGVLLLYGSSLPASVLTLVTRGNQGMFERMARLVEPGRRRAAILFADIQASGVLSRRLSSAAYFKLIRAATTAIDEVVVRHHGIVGKHAGDGVTAFFLAHDLGSDSAAARAAIDAGRTMPAAAYRAAQALLDDVGTVDLSSAALNVGLHWGGAMYMGQVVTGGRLEVTVLGDEVNEAARIQQSARDGAVLGSKQIVERLEPGDAAAVGLDPDRVAYRTVAELAGATEKAVRDAGGIAVTPIATAAAPD